MDQAVSQEPQHEEDPQSLSSEDAQGDQGVIEALFRNLYDTLVGYDRDNELEIVDDFDSQELFFLFHAIMDA